MPHGKFEKMTRSDTALYGNRKLLVCGLPYPAQPKFKAVLKMANMADVPVVWAGEDKSQTVISDLFMLDKDTGFGKASVLPRAIIVSGISENELHRLMRICKKTRMKKTIWAVLTPSSETWTLNQLLAELQAERKAMNIKK